MNTADPIVPMPKGGKRLAWKMMTASQPPAAQHHAGYEQVGTSADSEPGATTQSQAHACAEAAPITLPQDRYMTQNHKSMVSPSELSNLAANLQVQHHETSNKEESDNNGDGMSTQHDLSMTYLLLITIFFS